MNGVYRELRNKYNREDARRTGGFAVFLSFDAHRLFDRVAEAGA
jgi:hypothetical protein